MTDTEFYEFLQQLARKHQHKDAGMDKMMHPKEQDRQHVRDALDRWFHRNFADVPLDHPLYPRLLQAKQDACHVFGLDNLFKGDAND